MHIFIFYSTLVPSKFDVKLIKELLVVKIKPGLSSYANEPDKVKVKKNKFYKFVHDLLFLFSKIQGIEID